MPTTEQEKTKKNVLARLKRIEGQIRGIQGMIEGDKECKDVLTQIRAVRSALQSTNKLILKQYMHRCQTQCEENHEKGKEELNDFIEVLTGFLEG